MIKFLRLAFAVAIALALSLGFAGGAEAVDPPEKTCKNLMEYQKSHPVLGPDAAIGDTGWVACGGVGSIKCDMLYPALGLRC